MKCGLLNILLLTLLFYGECAAAPILRSTHYTTADGLAHNSVQGFCIDSSGMLWICSWFALERFDGYRFESFRPEEQHEFSRFKTAYLSDDDQIFVTTTGGQTLTFSLKDYTFKNCQKAPFERGERFRRSLTDAYGNRWEEAYEAVLKEVGATLPRRDAVDTHILAEVKGGYATYEGASYKREQKAKADQAAPTGIIDSQNDVGGWPELRSTKAPKDSDHDGMPDRWERRLGLDPKNPADGAAMAENGYTNLENYLNSL